MTAKRFTLELYDGTIRIKAIKDNGKVIYPPKIVELLNELDERYVDELNLRETLQQELQRVENENEQLKKENKLLLCTIVEILDFIEDKKEVSVEEMGRWWKEKEKELVEWLKNNLQEQKFIR